MAYIGLYLAKLSIHYFYESKIFFIEIGVDLYVPFCLITVYARGSIMIF